MSSSNSNENNNMALFSTRSSFVAEAPSYTKRRRGVEKEEEDEDEDEEEVLDLGEEEEALIDGK